MFEVGPNRERKIESNHDLTLVVARVLPRSAAKARKARREEGAKAAKLGAYATVPAVAGSVATGGVLAIAGAVAVGAVGMRYFWLRHKEKDHRRYIVSVPA